MSGIFEALRRSELERGGKADPSSSVIPSDLIQSAESGCPELEKACAVHSAASPDSRIVALNDRSSLGAEKFRLLCTRLRHLRQQRELKKLLITSAGPRDGKTFVAANLAFTLAHRKNEKILLLDGDLRQPRIAHCLGLNNLAGLGDWLCGEESISKFLHRVDGLGLWLLPAGKVPEHPLELVQSGRVSDLLAQFTSWFDWIVIDSPPMLPLADASFWARFADSVLVVVREGETSRRLLQKGLETIGHLSPISLVFNNVSAPDRSSYYNYYNHYYKGLNQTHKPATPGNGSAA